MLFFVSYYCLFFIVCFTVCVFLVDFVSFFFFFFFFGGGGGGSGCQ